MADRTHEKKRQVQDHELGTGGDQDIVRGPMAPDDATFVRIGTADDPFEADLITVALEEASIPVAARAQKDHLMDPLVNPNAPFWALMVPAEYEAQARAIVERCHAELRERAPEMERAAEEAERTGEYP